jgi:hypothetical protein
LRQRHLGPALRRPRHQLSDGCFGGGLSAPATRQGRSANSQWLAGQRRAICAVRRPDAMPSQRTS